MISFLKSYFWIPSLIGFLVYFRSIWFGSAWGDDIAVISPSARDFHLMIKSFSENLPGLHFMPFHYLQCFLINSIFKENAFPFGFHFYQVVLHSITCLLATLVLYKLTKNKITSILIVSLWTVHPLNVEILTRLGCGPAQVAGGVFCLAFGYCFLKLREVKSKVTKLAFSISGIFFFLASLTSYEQYFFFPLVILLIFIFLEDKKIFQKKSYLCYFVLPLSLIYPIYLIWKYFACCETLLDTSDELIKWTEMGGIKDVLFRAFWFVPQLIVHYFRLFFWPDFLAESKADWYRVGEDIISPYSLFCQMLVILLLISAYLLRKKIPLFSVGVVWFFLTMILVVQIIPVFSIVDEHYCYLPIVGIFLSLFSVVSYLSKIINRKFLIVGYSLIFCLLLWRTELYIPTNQDALTQMIAMAKEAPPQLKVKWIGKALTESYKENKVSNLPRWISEANLQIEFENWIDAALNTKINLSHIFGPIQMPYNFFMFRNSLMYLYDSHKVDKIPKLIDQALRLKDSWFGWIQVAEFLAYSKDWQGTWQFLKKAIKLNPRIRLLYSSMFLEAAKNANKFDEAQALIESYIKLKPKLAYPYLFGGVFYRDFDKPTLALKSFKEGIENDKVISVNTKELYLAAYVFFTANKMFTEAKKSLMIVKSFDPFDLNIDEMLGQLDKLQK